MIKSILGCIVTVCSFSTVFSQTGRDSISTKKDTTIYLVVDKPAEYPNGMDGLNRFIKRNFKYPEGETSRKTQGRIFIEFVIDTTGRVDPESVKTLKGFDRLFNEEAERVLKLTVWNPAELHGERVRQKLVLPIIF